MKFQYKVKKCLYHCNDFWMFLDQYFFCNNSSKNHLNQFKFCDIIRMSEEQTWQNINNFCAKYRTLKFIDFWTFDPLSYLRIIIFISHQYSNQRRTLGSTLTFLQNISVYSYKFAFPCNLVIGNWNARNFFPFWAL